MMKTNPERKQTMKKTTKPEAGLTVAHYQKTYGIQPEDTAIIKQITGDIQTQARLRDLWWDKKDLFRDPNTAKVDYNAAMKYLQEVAGISSEG